MSESHHRHSAGLARQPSISVGEFAARHGISRGTVYNLFDRGHLNFIQVGPRCRRITPKQEADWLERSTRGCA